MSVTDSYKNNAILSIREYLSGFYEELKNTGKIEYVTYHSRNTKELPNKKAVVAVIKVLLSFWIAIAIAIISAIIYTEVLPVFDISIGVGSYICIVCLILVALALIITWNYKSRKMIQKIFLTKENVSIFLTNDKVYEYDLNSMKFRTRRRRTNDKDIIRNLIFDLYIYYNNKKVCYLAKTNHKEEYFSFVIIMDAIVNHANANEFTDEELYRKFRKSGYGI